MRHLQQTSVLVSINNSLFSSILQYVIIVWGLTYKTHSKPLNILQKKVVRAIAFQSFTSPSTPTFSDLKIINLYDLLDLKLSTFVYETVTKVSPLSFHNSFETLTELHQYDIRETSKGDMSHKNTRVNTGFLTKISLNFSLKHKFSLNFL